MQVFATLSNPKPTLQDVHITLPPKHDLHEISQVLQFVELIVEYDPSGQMVHVDVLVKI